MKDEAGTTNDGWDHQATVHRLVDNAHRRAAPAHGEARPRG